MQIQFGRYRLDDQRFILERSGTRVSVRPKVFDLLAYLVRERDRVVPREELVEALWGGASVGMGSLSGLVNELRKLLCEDGRGPSSIRTVHARGYQFVAHVDLVGEEEVEGMRSISSAATLADHARSGAPEMLPAPIERALWLHLRDDAQRIDQFAAWLERLRSEVIASGPVRMEWKFGLQENAGPIRTMRTVDAAASSKASLSSVNSVSSGKGAPTSRASPSASTERERW